MERELHSVDDLDREMDIMLDSLRELNAEESGWRSRELSIAITELETARLWMRQALAVRGHTF